MKQRRQKKNLNTIGYTEMMPQAQQCGGLNTRQRKKCQERFDAIKMMGNQMISKIQLKKAMKQMGINLTEQELIDMIYQGDSKGQGYITYNAFQNQIQQYKQKLENQVINNLSLTYQQILRKQQEGQNSNSNQISQQYLQKYLLENFDLEINLKLIKGLGKSYISREEFKITFS